jgi:putative chitinase
VNRAALEQARNSARATLTTLEALLAAEAPPAAPIPQEPSAPAPAPAAGLQNAPAFFAVLRQGQMLGPQLTAAEVGGCEAIAAAGAGKFPTSWAAYALATAYHETAGTMQPIKEYGGEAYLRRMYDIQGARPEKARELGNLTPGDGVRYCGRGYVQLTGKANYARAEREIGQPLVAEPDLAMQPDIAARIMARGMSEGWFTGKSLRDYIPAKATRQHFTNARRIINGTDKADLIAGYALAFMDALTAGEWA